jgi:flagellar biosynthesis protein FlhB
VDKSFPPSIKKLERARKEGQTAKSPVTTAACVMLWITFLITVKGPLPWLRERFLVLYGGIDNFQIFLFIGSSVGLVLGGAAVIGLFSERLQSGGVWSAKFDLSRLNVVTGVARLKTNFLKIMFSILSAVIFILIMLVTSGTFFKCGIIKSLQEAALPSPSAVLWQGALLLFLFGIIDWARERRQHLKRLGMTFDEVKREIREEEGDFYLRSQRRSLHEQLIHEEIVNRVKRSRFIVVERAQA